MKTVPACALLALSFAHPASAAPQTGSYVGFNPWSASLPDCVAAPGGNAIGLGGSCFAVPAGIDRFRVTLVDDAFGPGFGALNLCVDTSSSTLCDATPICGGNAEGDVPLA